MSIDIDKGDLILPVPAPISDYLGVAGFLVQKGTGSSALVFPLVRNPDADIEVDWCPDPIEVADERVVVVELPIAWFGYRITWRGDQWEELES